MSRIPSKPTYPATDRFQAGYIYPLVDQSRYEDGGQNYGFAAIPTDADPGVAYIQDAWIVNDRGEVHPGYAANPVPIRLEDVILAQGKPVSRDLPEPMSIFDSPLFGGG